MGGRSAVAADSGRPENRPASHPPAFACRRGIELNVLSRESHQPHSRPTSYPPVGGSVQTATALARQHSTCHDRSERLPLTSLLGLHQNVARTASVAADGWMLNTIDKSSRQRRYTLSA